MNHKLCSQAATLQVLLTAQLLSSDIQRDFKFLFGSHRLFQEDQQDSTVNPTEEEHIETHVRHIHQCSLLKDQYDCQYHQPVY